MFINKYLLIDGRMDFYSGRYILTVLVLVPSWCRYYSSEYCGIVRALSSSSSKVLIILLFRC